LPWLPLFKFLLDVRWLMTEQKRSGGLLGGRGGTLEDSHDVALLHDQVLDAVELDLGAGPLAEQDAVAGLHVERHELAVLIPGARADGDDLAFHRLFLGRVRNDDAALGLAFFLDSLDHDAVVKRTELHAVASIFPWLPTRPERAAQPCQHSPVASAKGAPGFRGGDSLSQGGRTKRR